MNVLFHYDAGPNLTQKLAALATDGLAVSDCPLHDDGRFAALMRETDVLWHVLRPVGAADMDAAPRLRLIQKIGVGVNTIDLEAAKERGIAVCNMPGTNSRAVAEMSLLLMLAALRRMPPLDRATREGTGWVLGPEMQEQYGEVGGRTVGLVGFGAVPRLLAPVLSALGARVIYTATGPKADAAYPFVDLPTLLAEADIVSLHCPLTPATGGMLDRAALQSMKPGSILVNTARGELVDELALADVLRDGPLAAAGLDVFQREPIDPDHPLLALDNVAFMPHLAWLTPETMDRSIGVGAENCRRLRDGADLLHRVV